MTWPVVPLASALASAEAFADGDWIESKDQDPNGDVRLVQLADIGDGEYLDKSARFLTAEKAHALRCTFLRPGDVLVARMPDPLGRACIFPGDAKPSVTVVDVCIIRPSNDGPDRRFLVQCLNAGTTRAQIAGFATGTTRSRISRSNLATIRIPLPPLLQQRCIAAVLDKAEALRAKRRAALAQLDTLTQSIFVDMFGDPATNPKGWFGQTIADICEVRGGKRLPKGEEYSPTPTAYRYIRVTDLKSGAVDESALVYLKPEVQASIKRYIVNTGDVIISIAGSIGLIASVPPSLDGANLTENAAKLVPRRHGEYDACFLAVLLQTPYAQSQISSHIGQVTIGKLALFRIEKIQVRIPPFPLQDDFARRVAQVDKLKVTHRAALTDIDALFASLQHRAFRGAV